MDEQAQVEAPPASAKGYSAQGMAFRVIKAGTAKFAELTKETTVQGFHNLPSTVIYDALAMRYNQTEAGDLLVVALPIKPSVGNLRKVLASRGLNESDFRLFRPIHDENGERYPDGTRPMVLQRITGQEMRIIQPYPAMPARLAKEAEERGATYDFAHPPATAKEMALAHAEARAEALTESRMDARAVALAEARATGRAEGWAEAFAQALDQIEAEYPEATAALRSVRLIIEKTPQRPVVEAFEPRVELATITPFPAGNEDLVNT